MSKPLTATKFIRRICETIQTIPENERRRDDIRKDWEMILEKAGYEHIADKGQEALTYILFGCNMFRLVEDQTKVEIGIGTFNTADRKYSTKLTKILKENVIAGGSSADVFVRFRVKGKPIVLAISSKCYSKDIGIIRTEVQHVLPTIQEWNLEKGEYILLGLAHSGLSRPNRTGNYYKIYIDISSILTTEMIFKTAMSLFDNIKELSVDGLKEAAKKLEPVYLFSSLEELNLRIDETIDVISRPPGACMIKCPFKNDRNRIIDTASESSNDISGESDTEDSSQLRERIAENDKIKAELEKIIAENDKIKAELEKIIAEKDKKIEELEKELKERDARYATPELDIKEDTTSESSNDISGEFPTDTEEDEEDEAEKDALKAECEELVDIYSEKAPFNDWKVNQVIRNYYYAINNNPTISELKEIRDKFKTKT